MRKIRLASSGLNTLMRTIIAMDGFEYNETRIEIITVESTKTGLKSMATCTTNYVVDTMARIVSMMMIKQT